MCIGFDFSKGMERDGHATAEVEQESEDTTPKKHSNRLPQLSNSMSQKPGMQVISYF